MPAAAEHMKQSDSAAADAPTAAPGRAGGRVLARVVALACLAPILAMVVLAASPFDAVRAVRVEPIVQVEPDEQAGASDAAGEGGTLFNVRRPTDALRLAEDSSTVLALPDATGALRLYRRVRLEMMDVTAYCPCTRCCGKYARGITASGKRVSYNGGKFVAAPRELAFGTKLLVPGYARDAVVEVADRGGAIKGDKLDVFFPTHEAARKWGRQKLPVWILEEAESDSGSVPMP